MDGSRRYTSPDRHDREEPVAAEIKKKDHKIHVAITKAANMHQKTQVYRRQVTE